MCIRASHIFLRRGKSKLYLETIQLYKIHARYAHEVDVNNWISHHAKGNKIQGGQVN